MDKIFIHHNPKPAVLDVMGVYDWPIWCKEKINISLILWQ